MAVRNDFTAGEVLAAADLNDTFGAKVDYPSGGSNGDALIKDGTAALWGTAGKILQIVRATDSTNRTTTSSSFVDVTGMTVGITPQKSNSAVLLLAVGRLEVIGAAGASAAGNIQITDSSNNAISGAEGATFVGVNLPTGNSLWLPLFLMAYATPATTSPVTYKMRFRSTAGVSTVTLSNASITGQMFAIEVSA
jgi:hypothetical protein